MDLRTSFSQNVRRRVIDLVRLLTTDFDQLLFERAEQADNNQDQSLYFEVMREFRFKSAELLDRYTDFLDRALADFTAASTDTIDGFQRETEELSLVEKEDLEDELAVSIIVNKANTRFAESLWKLNQRLAVLRGGKKVDDESNPCGPQHLSVALREAARALDVPVRIRLLLYSTFEKQIMPKLGELYDELNSELSAQRILPNLKYEDARSTQDKGRQSGATAVQPQSEVPFWADAQAMQVQQELIDAILSLQANLFTGPRHNTYAGTDYGNLVAGSDNANPASFINVNDFALALSAIQAELPFRTQGNVAAARSVDAVEAQLMAQLNQFSSSSQRNTIVNSDANTIDMVGMLFKYVLDDEALPDPVKTLISHLHTPMLKVALIDEDFFHNTQHPARRLINMIAEVGSRWINGDKPDRVVYPKLKSIVSEVLSEFVDDVGIFERLLNDLVKFAESMLERSRLAERRNLEAEKGLERLARAKRRATREIRARLIRDGVHQDIVALVEKPWVEFLSFNLLRHGDKGDSWQRAKRLLDQVVASLNLDLDDVQRENLNVQILQELSDFGYEDHARRDLYDSVKRAHRRAASLKEEALQEPAGEPESAAEEATGPAPAEDAAPLAQQSSTEHTQQADDSAESGAGVPDEDAGSALPEATSEAVGEQAAEASEGDATETGTADPSLAARQAAGTTVAPANITTPNIAPPNIVARSAGQDDDGNEDFSDLIGEDAVSSDAKTASAIERQLYQLEARSQKVENLGGLEKELAYLDTVEFGAWFEFDDLVGQKSQVLKLAWYSSISDHYMFVNEAGIKSAVKSKLDLASGLHEGEIREIRERKPFMERALSSIIDRLQRLG